MSTTTYTLQVPATRHTINKLIQKIMENTTTNVAPLTRE